MEEGGVIESVVKTSLSMVRRVGGRSSWMVKLRNCS